MYPILEKFPELQPYESDINLRMTHYLEKREQLLKNSDSLLDFANAHAYYGFHYTGDGWVYREWAPAADQLYLTGDFNNWQWEALPLKKLEEGNWEVYLPGDLLHKGSRVLAIVRNGDRLTQHMPTYTRRAVQDQNTASWCCEVWDDVTPYPWTDGDFHSDEPPLIYEAHVGMSSEEGKIATYREFADQVLPHVQAGGYNTIQLMAVMEHPYYGSFGYQVSNFYAASSWFGLPEDLKYLVDKAHSMGIRVLLDLVHSHAVKNTLEGLNEFDGTVYQFFHEGPKGDHKEWGTKCFNYDKTEVLHYLLSNLKFWLTEFHFDGFRFDGVTSMLYHNHGMGVDFTLDKYFTMNTDVEAITYLQLANELIHQVKPNAITIAEDMSGMPGMCEPVSEGGIGFDYRLGMGLPDMWIRLVKKVPDEKWNMDAIWTELTFRNARTIAYVESHDQALVGDQTMIFRLAGAEMYEKMDRIDHSFGIDRATALHKMIRLLTMAAGGNGYLNFMGNEFGHPEWIDFPREGNGWSYHYCRRQWSLLKNPFLKYQDLNEFDVQMLAAAKRFRIFDQYYPDLKRIHSDDHVLAFERGGALFVFNFDPVKDYLSYAIPARDVSKYRLVLGSDETRFGGFGRLRGDEFAVEKGSSGEPVLNLWLPPRTALVLEPETVRNSRKLVPKPVKRTGNRKK